MSIAVTGASGLIGTALCKRLEADGHRVTRIGRAATSPDAIVWDPSADRLDVARLEGIDAFVHLAGAGIGDHRWTDAYKQTLVESRTLATGLLARSIAAMSEPPRCLVSASAVGWYGPRGEEELSESSERGAGFLSDLCRDWEAATRPAQDAGVRVCHARTGVVLTRRGGALRKQLPLFKLGLGGRVGSGRQWLSWISLTDQVDAIIHLLGSQLSGAVNLTAPNPVTNSEFTKALGAAVRRPAIFPAPVAILKLALGRELVDNLLLTGQRVTSSRLLDDGFRFTHTYVGDALQREV